MRLEQGGQGWLAPDAAYIVPDGSVLTVADADGVALTLAAEPTAIIVDWKCGSLRSDAACQEVGRQIGWYAALLAHGEVVGRARSPLPERDWKRLRYVGRAVSLDDGTEHWFAFTRDEVAAAAEQFAGESFALQEMVRDSTANRPRRREELPVLPPHRRAACVRCLYHMVCRDELAATAVREREVSIQLVADISDPHSPATLRLLAHLSCV